MKVDIENISEEKGRMIANAIMEKYDEYSYSYEARKVEKEIYERSLHEATAFFLIHGEAKFDEEILENLKSLLKMRLANPKEVKKLQPEEILANVIKIHVSDFLLSEGDIVI